MTGRRFSRDISERLADKISVSAETGCWNWHATKNNKGYGKLWVDGRKQYAHRVSYVIHNGHIPRGINVCHRCDNPSCINPSHLFLGTQAENIADRDAKGRQRISERKGADNGNSKLNEQDVVAIRAAKGMKLRELASQYGVTPTQISFIRRGKSWGHVPG